MKFLTPKVVENSEGVFADAVPLKVVCAAQTPIL